MVAQNTAIRASAHFARVSRISYYFYIFIRCQYVTGSRVSFRHDPVLLIHPFCSSLRRNRCKYVVHPCRVIHDA